MARLEIDPAPSGDRPTLFAWWRAVLVPALGVVAIAAYWLAKAPPQKAALAPSIPPIPAELAELIPPHSPAKVLAWTEKLDQPLENEIQFVVSDAKTALLSLTANFLPEHEF
jgi:hypothetical protein